jgi:thermostable 8-oxoguanine DNA glycosylase
MLAVFIEVRIEKQQAEHAVREWHSYHYTYACTRSAVRARATNFYQFKTSGVKSTHFQSMPCCVACAQVCVLQRVAHTSKCHAAQRMQAMNYNSKREILKQVTKVSVANLASLKLCSRAS